MKNIRTPSSRYHANFAGASRRRFRTMNMKLLSKILPAALIFAGALIGPQAPAQTSGTSVVLPSSTNASITLNTANDWYEIEAGTSISNATGNGAIIGAARSSPWYVTNAGAVTGVTNGMYFSYSAKVTNTGGGLIQGDGSASNNAGIYLTAAGHNCEIINSATILGSALHGIYSGGTSTIVRNNATGLILGAGGYGIYINALHGFVDNTGFINGLNNGVYFNASGTLINQATGLIKGDAATASTQAGVYFTNSALGYVENSGTIVGGLTGIHFGNLAGDNIVVNHTGGLIQSQSTSVTVAGAAIIGATGAATTVSINNAGIIHGANDGIRLPVPATIMNTGTIIGGSGTAIALLGTGASAISTLEFGNGSKIVGDIVSAAAESNTITLAGSGTLDGNITGTSGHAAASASTLAMNGADWTITGTVQLSGSAATTLSITAGRLTIGGDVILANAGGIRIEDGALISGAASLSDAHAVTLASSGTLAGTLVRTAGQALSASAGSAITGDLSLNNATLALTPATPGAGAFAVGGDFTFADSTLELGLFNAADNIISIDGNISISGANIIDLMTGMSGTYTLAGLGGLAGSVITIDGAPQGGSRQNAAATSSGADLQIIFYSDISRRLTWTGSDSALWDSAADNWAGSNNTKNYAALDTVVFDGVADAAHPANRSITLTGNMRVSDIIVSSNADYTFVGAGGITSGTAIVTETGNPENLTGVTGKLFKSGAGKLTFANTGANNFSGGIEISGGAIAFDNTAQIGTEIDSGTYAPISFTGAGGALSGAGTLVAEVTIAPAATATFDIAGGKLELAAGVSGAGTLEKTGAGTLEISSDLAHTGAVVISGGTLAAGVENLGGASVTNNAALVLRSDNAAVYSGAITGAGAFFKTGTGALEITSTLALGAVTISQGALVIKPAARLAAASVFNIASGAALMGTGSFSAPQLTNAGAIKVGRAADPAAPHGVMTFAGNYTGASGAQIHLDMSLNAAGAMEFDRFIINGNAGGVTNVSLQERPDTVSLNADTSLLPALGDMLAVTGSVASGAFVHDGIVEFGGGQYRWDNALNNGAGGWRTLVAEPPSAIGALDAAALLIGRASFASLENRLAAARETNLGREKQFWIAGLQRSEKLGAVRYDRYETAPRADANTQGIQTGLDWITLPDPETIVVFGIFTDYAKSDMHLPGRTTNSRATSTAGGLYCSWIYKVWHVDAFVRYGSEKYDIAATRVAPFSTAGYSWGGMLSAGCHVSLGKTQKWRLAPAVRFACQDHRINAAIDDAGRRYTVASASMREFCASLRLSRDGTWKNALKCAPYVRAGWLYDFGGESRLVVAGETFKNNLGGGGAEIGAGILLEAYRNIALQAGFAWFKTAASQGATATLGIARAW